MKSKITVFAVLFLSVFVLASCLKNESDEVVYYDDTAITSFYVGTLNRYVHTTSSTGEDSVYKTTLDCSKYKFYIDQYKREIYNTDSLPLGVDVSKVLVTATSKNAGLIAVNLMTQDRSGDSLVYVSSTDSLDFTNPLEFRVYNTSGTAYRSYAVHVNVHQEVADSFHWSRFATNDAVVASMVGMRILPTDGKLWLMGNDGSGSKVYVGNISHDITWTVLSSSPYPADAYKSFTLVHGIPTFVSDGNLYQCFDDGRGCMPMAMVNLAFLYGAGDGSMYGLTGEGTMTQASSVYADWQSTLLDDDANLLPTQDVNFIAISSKVNLNTNTLLLIGNRDESFATDTAAIIWGKVEELNDNSQDQPWFYYTPSIDNKYLLPRLNNLQVVKYDLVLLAMGGRSFDGKLSAFAHFYRSEDEGITWHTDATYSLPSDFSSSDTSFAMVCDANNYLWIFCGGTGQIWRGRTNRLGWNQEQVGYEK
ncbi:MAG: hypothetical protein J5867_04795 [Prevotella sp.]|nr:hypothetical protein [Prevotella sp.]